MPLRIFFACAFAVLGFTQATSIPAKANLVEQYKKDLVEEKLSFQKCVRARKNATYNHKWTVGDLEAGHQLLNIRTIGENDYIEMIRAGYPIWSDRAGEGCKFALISCVVEGRAKPFQLGVPINCESPDEDWKYSVYGREGSVNLKVIGVCKGERVFLVEENEIVFYSGCSGRWDGRVKRIVYGIPWSP